MKTLAIVELLPNGPPRLKDIASNIEGYESGGQLFTRCSVLGEWLGFYDWLRTHEGIIVGVRLRTDDPEALAMFEPFVGADVTIDGSTVSIRTTSDGLAIDALSDDADFGGNAIYYGDCGGLAISFNSPCVRLQQ